MSKNKKKFFNTREVGKELGLSRQQIAFLIRKNKIKAEKLNQHWMIHRNEVDSVKKQRTE